jgi:hypothetical protein
MFRGFHIFVLIVVGPGYRHGLPRRQAVPQSDS